MNRSQEASLALMIIMPLCALIPGSVGVLLVYTEGARFIPLLMFALTIVLGSVFWLIPAIMQKVRKSKRQQMDERDLLIYKNAVVAAHVVLWVYLLIVCLVIWRLVGSRGTVSVNVIPLVLVGGVSVFLLVEYLAAFVQYGRGGKGELT